MSGRQSPGFAGPDALRIIRDAAERIETPITKGRLIWRAWGAGLPLVLLHGGHGGWSHWARNVIPISRVRRVLAPDMPGFGESDDAVAMTDVNAVADELDRGLLTILGGTRFDLVGFSFGGSVAGVLAARIGPRARSVTLVGSGGMGLTRPPPVASMVRWRELHDPEAIRAAHRTNLAIHMFHRPARIDDLAVTVQTENTRRTRLRSREISRTNLLTKHLPAVRAPLAGIWGREDATARGYIDERRAFLRAIDPKAPFVVIDDAGHWVQYEAADAFNEALLGIIEAARLRDERPSGS